MLPRKIKLAAAMIAIGVVSFAAGTFAQGRYPEINRAERRRCNGALGDLRAARDVFGGHKVAAERLVQQAIGELRSRQGRRRRARDDSAYPSSIGRARRPITGRRGPSE